MKGRKFRNSSNDSLCNRNGAMFNNESMADVHFLVGSSEIIQKIPAHKYVLAVGSSVFKAMFYGSLPEKDEIEIPDIKPSIFLTLLQYLYCDEITLNDDNIFSILLAAKKYQVEYVVNVCLNYVETSLNGKNVWLFLNNWELFDEIDDFVQRCWEIIAVDTKVALKTEYFFHINKETLQKFLNLETLNCGEVDIFKAVVKWFNVNNSYTEHATDLKEKFVGNLKYLIRIPTMNLEEFVNIVVNSNLLSHEEIMSILKYYASKKKSDLKYSTVPRTLLKAQCCRFRCSIDEYKSYWLFYADFKVNKSIFITYLDYNSSFRRRMRVQSIELNKPNCALSLAETCAIGDLLEFMICKHPIRVQANEFHRISFKVFADPSYISVFSNLRNYDENSEIAHGSVNFQFKHGKASNDDDYDVEFTFYSITEQK